MYFVSVNVRHLASVAYGTFLVHRYQIVMQILVCNRDSYTAKRIHSTYIEFSLED